MATSSNSSAQAFINLGTFVCHPPQNNVKWPHFVWFGEHFSQPYLQSKFVLLMGKLNSYQMEHTI